MTQPETVGRRRRWLVFSVPVVVGATLIGVASCQSVASPAAQSPASSYVSSLSPPVDAVQGSGGRGLGEAEQEPQDRPSGEAGNGSVPDGVTVFDEDVPAVANLDSDLLVALREAATDAADDGVELYVTSGWRTPEYQDQLLREAIAKYGSEEEAARWVATAETSAHVSGDAVDIGDLDATAWLSEQGAAYGLCQIYDNEPWHYELRTEAVDQGCPAKYADPSYDPRMRQ